MDLHQRQIPDPVNSTISQDFAAGKSAEQTKNLQNFLEETVNPLFVGTSNLSSHGLTDYQMQLMLLEQQNKKRLLMARQDQKSMDIVDNHTSRHVEQVGFSNKRQRMDAHEKPYLEGTISEEMERPFTFSTTDVQISKPEMPYHQTISADRSSHCSTFVQNPLRDHMSIATMSDKSTEYEKSPILYSRIVYKIVCFSKHPSRYHQGLTFEDVPTFKPTLSPGTSAPIRWSNHLNGSCPVPALDDYMEENDDIAFIILRYCNCSEKFQPVSSVHAHRSWYETILLKSPTLRSTFYTIAGCYVSRPSQSPKNEAYSEWMPQQLDNSKLLEKSEIYAPHLFFYHHRQRLHSYAAQNGDIAPQIISLLEYISQTYGEDYDEADKLFRQCLVTRRHLIKMFMPNEIVVSTDPRTGELASYVVRQWPTIYSPDTLSLECWFWTMDGAGLARKQVFLAVPLPAEGNEIQIRSLPVIPLRFLDPELKLRLKLRGQKLWSLRFQSYVTYKGWNVSKDQFYPDSRFMVDYTTYKRMHPTSDAFSFDKSASLLLFDPRPLRVSRDATDDGDISMLLPPDVHGFYFTEKKWLNILVDGICPVKWNKSAFDRLVLPPQTKDVIKALVTVRTSQRGVKHGLGLAGKREDIISGKGNGLIMLLHGGPGTGKTLTAESVAEIAEMPLYKVTCGDVGTSADVVEKYLNNVLTLGKEWNCVLLLDEADVFLEERSLSDLARNSLVSVFLRILEYYDGILMLTSNRVGTFDEAFKSRIQVALYYKTLNRSSRKKIWQNFLDMMNEDNEDVDFDELHSRIDELANYELNGRQIRNALTTARQLAIYKKEQLEWSHLEHALSLSTEFNNYLKRLQGHTDDQWATEEGIR